jgi:CheY-like chemotaxis protein
MHGRHGSMTVRLSSKPGLDGKEWIELSVADTGCGIPRENLDRIFEPYFTTKEKTSGTGMGLAMVHGIISRQGGSIEVESEVGEGTTFRIYLPVVKRDSPIEQIVSIGDLRNGTGNILLVDDEEQVVQVTGEILQSLGYKVVGKTSPREALDVFNEDPKAFDLLLTDLTMPELTGLELAETVKQKRSDLPVILCTGYSDQIPEEEAVRAGIREYCMKPISMRELSQLVGKFLGN